MPDEVGLGDEEKGMHCALGQEVVDRKAGAGLFAGKADLAVDHGVGRCRDVAAGQRLGGARAFGLGGGDLGLKGAQLVFAGRQLHEAQPFAHLGNARGRGVGGGAGLVQPGLADMAVLEQGARALERIGRLAGGSPGLGELVPRCFDLGYTATGGGVVETGDGGIHPRFGRGKGSAFRFGVEAEQPVAGGNLGPFQDMGRDDPARRVGRNGDEIAFGIAVEIGILSAAAGGQYNGESGYGERACHAQASRGLSP